VSMEIETAVAVLQAHGYWLAFAVGFAEFAGAPLASSVVLVTGGALAAGGGLSLPAFALSAAAGGFVADLGWYFLARWKGQFVVNSACGLTSNPTACVDGGAQRLGVMGSPFLLLGKFFPGSGNLLAPAAGLAGLSPGYFLPKLAFALVAWAGAYTGLGWIFADELRALLAWIVASGRWVALAALVLVAGAALWRSIRLRKHREVHGTAKIVEKAGEAEIEVAG